MHFKTYRGKKIAIIACNVISMEYLLLKHSMLVITHKHKHLNTFLCFVNYVWINKTLFLYSQRSNVSYIKMICAKMCESFVNELPSTQVPGAGVSIATVVGSCSGKHRCGEAHPSKDDSAESCVMQVICCFSGLAARRPHATIKLIHIHNTF